MGVTREADDIFFYGYIDEEHELSVAVEGYENVEYVNDNKKKSHKRKNKGGNVIRQSMWRDDGGSGVCHKMSTRQLRNYDRLKQLMNLIEKEDITDLDYDLFEPSFSAFAELFVETEKMKAWNEFVNASEEEQDRVISQTGGARSVSVRTKDEAEKNARDAYAIAESLDDSWEFVGDNRKVHPAYTATACFKRISGNLRAILKKRNLPKDTLAQLENEVTAFFNEWPTSVYVSQLLTRFERLLIHALCQYLDLTSHKLTHAAGETDNERQHTQILNKHGFFCAPLTKLVDFLNQRH